MNRAIRVEVRAGTPADLDVFYGGRVTLPGAHLLVVEAEGVLVGVGGITAGPGEPFAFLDCPPRFMPAPLAATRLAADLVAAACPDGGRVLVNPDPRFPRARRWLDLIGFHQSDHPDLLEWVPFHG